MTLRPVAVVIALAVPLAACDASKIPFVWKAYAHPSYGFSLKTPRDWKIEEGGDFGALLNFLPPEDDTLFRANANLVVQERSPDTTLDALADQSVQQLTALLQEYRLLGKIPAKLGNLPAVELRAHYKASEGERVLRTIIAVTARNAYVLTFTARVEREAENARDFNAFAASFSIPTT